MDLETAELVKVAANAFLATKISFINAMAEVCEESGADVIPLAEALGYDARIGSRFLSPGLGYGGGCLPKDIRAIPRHRGRTGRELAGQPAGHGGRDQPRPPGPGGHAGSPGGRRLAGGQPGGGARRRVQAQQRRRPGFAQPGHLRSAGGRGSDRVRTRPGGHAQRGRQTARPALRAVGIGGGRRRRRGPAPHRVVRLPGHRPGRPDRGRRPASDHRRAVLPRRGFVAQGWLVCARSRAA